MNNSISRGSIHPHQPTSMKARKAPWSHSLATYLHNPQLHPEYILNSTKDYVVVKDKFPKARHHFLVIARIDRPMSVFDITRDHLAMLIEMKKAADALAAEFSSEKFKIGFHPLPSMSHLHLHVVSDDHISPSVKKRAHYNSFTTKFFLPIEEVISVVGNCGQFTTNLTRQNFEQLLRSGMVCHVCKKAMKNLPFLKNHLLEHFPTP